MYIPKTFVSLKMPRYIFVCAIPHKVGSRPTLLPFRIFYDTNQILHTAYLSNLRALPILSSGLQIHDQPTCLFSPYLSACPPSEKRNGDIKSRNVAVGIKNRTYNGYDKSNGLSPTLNTDSVILSGVIDANNHRGVAMLDTENDFLHAENDKYVLMLLYGKLAELLVKVYP